MDLHVLLHCSCHLVFSSTCLGTRSVHAAHARLPTRTRPVSSSTRTWIIARCHRGFDLLDKRHPRANFPRGNGIPESYSLRVFGTPQCIPLGKMASL